MKNLQKKMRILSFVFAIGFMFYGMTLPVNAYIQKAGTVNEAVTLRQNADSSSKQVMELTSGQAVKVNNELKDENGTVWYQLIVGDTTLGYVPASTVTISDSAAGYQGSTMQTVQTVTITERIGTVTAGTAIRVRQQATTTSEQIASMESGDTFLVLSDIDTGDGYTWYKVEFDDHGTKVIGHVRSDLVTVEEVTREVEQVVEVPVTTPSEDETSAPYSVSSQVNAEGTTVWYLTDNATGDAKEISSLLNSEPVQKSGGGVYKVFVVILLILVILAAGAATFFYLRWRDAEDFILELREKQVRAKKQPAPNRGSQTSPVQTKQAPQTMSGMGIKPAASTKTEGAGALTGMSVPKKPVFHTDSLKTTSQATVQQPTKTTAQQTIKAEEQTIPQQPVKPAGQTMAQQSVKTTASQTVKAESQTIFQQPVKPMGQTTAQQQVKTTISQTVKAESQTISQQPIKAATPQPVKTTIPQSANSAAASVKPEVLPNTMDIVKATQQELKNNQTGSVKKPQTGGWKSKNFLTDDDDLEFDFLEMEE